METAVAALESPIPRSQVLQWHPIKRVLFRFVFCYFVLYSWPESGRIDFLNSLPGGEPVSDWLNKPLHAVVPSIAARVFHITGQAATYFRTGSGDTLQYITTLLYFVFALAATLVWSVLDRQRLHYVPAPLLVPDSAALHAVCHALRIRVRQSLSSAVRAARPFQADRALW